MPLQGLIADIHKVTSFKDISALKACVKASFDWLKEEFEPSKVSTLVCGRAKFVDSLLQHMWTLHGLTEQKDLSLVAVGGYGRGQLQPHSDIDLLILSQDALTKAQETFVSRFVTQLWDLGLDIGQSVRTVSETMARSKADITIATNLVESRLLSGCHQTFDLLQKKVQGKHFWTSKSFFKAKLTEQELRHAKFNGTAYNLEPNVKENPGCLRDIQSIGWVAKKHFKVLKGKELVEHGYFTEREFNELIDCRKRLWSIRFALHLEAGRGENRLLFDHQPAVAKRLGYGDEGKASVERMMKDFFRTVTQISELNGMLLQRFHQNILKPAIKKRRTIDDQVELIDGNVSILDENYFDSPLKILEFFLLLTSTEHVEGLHASTVHLLRNARYQFREQYFQQDSKCRVLFMALLRHPKFYGLPWDLMHKHAILQNYFPQWDHIAGMMQFDLFHAYTVDEHTHKVVKNLDYYNSQESKADFPRCNRIMGNLDKPELIFLAGIFHDIGKGRNGDHSVLGAQDVVEFCHLHEINEADTELVKWLIENHLLMSVVAQRRDIYDPDVVHDFAGQVRNKNNLNHLYVLTLADIRATNDNLWNDWKASLLRELYTMTRKALENGLESKVDQQSRIDEHKQQAKEILYEQNFSDEMIDSLWQRFESSYFIRFTPKQIAWHSLSILSLEQVNENSLLVDINDETHRAGTEILIYGKDRPSIFAQVASVLDSRKISIHDAHILNTVDGCIFDSFTVLEHDGSRISSPSRMNSLKHAIEVQLDKQGIEHLNKRKISRQMRHLNAPTKLRFFDQPQRTILELEAFDAPGLLALISHTFVALDISLHMAKITTIGERAEDTFIISNSQGSTLTTQQQLELKQKLVDLLDDNIN